MYDYLDLRQKEKLIELVPYKVLAPDADEIIEELERLNKELGIFQRENDLLKHKLNDIAWILDYLKSKGDE